METSLNQWKCAILITIVVGMVSLVSTKPYHFGRDHMHSTVRDQVVRFSSASMFALVNDTLHCVFSSHGSVV